MELTTMPRPVRGRRVRRRFSGLLVVGLLTTGLLLLTPLGLGLHHGVVRDPVMGRALDTGSWSGSLSLDEVVPGTELRTGDVVTFVPPGRWADEGPVTRRVVNIDADGVARTRGDAAARPDPWVLDLQQESVARVAVRVPLLGAVVAALGPWWLGLGAAALLAGALLLALPRVSRQPGAPQWRTAA